MEKGLPTTKNHNESSAWKKAWNRLSAFMGESNDKNEDKTTSTNSTNKKQQSDTEENPPKTAQA